MTVTVDGGALASAMKHAAAVTETRQTIPIFANVRLIAQGGSLEVMTSDLDCEFRQALACEPTDGELATTVDARRLSALAGAVDKGARITLEEDGGALVVKCGRSRWRLPTLPVRDFPVMPEAELASEIEVAGAELAAALGRVQWAMLAGDIVRPYLAGVLLHGDAGKVALAATNGVALIRVPLSSDLPADAPEQILSAKFVRLLSGLCTDAAAVRLSWSKDKARAVVGSVTLTAKAIIGQYPDVHRATPRAGEAPLVFDPVSLRGALRRVALVENVKTRLVKFEREDDLVRIVVENDDTATAREEMPASGPAAPITGFNSRYLDQIAEAIGGDSIALHQPDPEAPARFERLVSDGAIGVVMPMRV